MALASWGGDGGVGWGEWGREKLGESCLALGALRYAKIYSCNCCRLEELMLQVQLLLLFQLLSLAKQFCKSLSHATKSVYVYRDTICVLKVSKN